MYDQTETIKKLIKLADTLKNFYPEPEYNELMKKGVTKGGFTYRYPDNEREQLLYLGEVVATFYRKEK